MILLLVEVFLEHDGIPGDSMPVVAALYVALESLQAGASSAAFWRLSDKGFFSQVSSVH